MKKLLVVTVVLTLLVSCGDGGGGFTVLQTATFWAYDEVNKKSYQLTADMLADNSLCEVWVEKGSGVSQAQAAAIANEYSSRIYPRMKNAFSQPINLTAYGKSFPSTVELAHFIVEEFTGQRNSKLTILLLDIKDGYSKDTDPYVAGYFDSKDFYKNTDVMQQLGSNLRSNERTMLYMDTYPALSKGMGEFYDTIAHELQHLMNFSTYMIIENKSLVDVWINEGLSAAAEWVYSQKYNQFRISWFSADPTQLIRQGNNFFVWNNRPNTSPVNDNKGSEILDDYATVYLFFQWLRLKGSGTDVYKKITFSSKADYEAVVEAMQGTTYSNWQLLLEGWMKANYYTSGSNSYGSDTELNNKVKINYAPGGSASISLFPGEGVYSVANSFSVPVPAGNIIYIGLQSGGTTTPSGSFSGALLTYNKSTTVQYNNGVLTTTPDQGTITGTAPPANIVASGRFLMPDGLRGPYAISMGDMIRRRGRIERNFDLTVMDSSKLFKGVLIE